MIKMFPKDIKINQSWRNILEQRTEYWLIDLYEFVDNYTGNSPKKENLFKPLMMNFDDIVCVFVGSEPYIKNADGLAFSSNEIKISSKNIYSEIEKTLKLKMNYLDGNLDYLHKQGILLINTFWTSKTSNILWSSFTSMILEIISSKKENIIFVLCGNEANKLSRYILKKQNHLIISTTHPGDNGKHFKLNFKLIEDFLIEKHNKKIIFSNIDF